MGINSVSMDLLLAKLDAARTAATGLSGQGGAVNATKAPRDIDFGAMLKTNIDKVDQALQGPTRWRRGSRWAIRRSRSRSRWSRCRRPT